VLPSVTGFIGTGVGINDWLASDTFVPALTEDGRNAGWTVVATATEPHVLTGLRHIDLRAATTARLRFWSRLASGAPAARVEVRIDGGHWLTLGNVPPSPEWALVDVDLRAYLGAIVEVRFLFDGIEPMRFGAPDVWWLSDVQLELD
jgi:hypothetical protein